MAIDRTAWQRDWAVAPGEILQEALEDRDMSQSELARRMGRPVKTINEIVNGKAAITPDTAIQLELTLGITCDLLEQLGGRIPRAPRTRARAARSSRRTRRGSTPSPSRSWPHTT